jgi:hypothetical protein
MDRPRLLKIKPAKTRFLYRYSLSVCAGFVKSKQPAKVLSNAGGRQNLFSTAKIDDLKPLPITCECGENRRSQFQPAVANGLPRIGSIPGTLLNWYAW